MQQIIAFILLPLIMTILGPVGLEALHQAETDTLQHILKRLEAGLARYKGRSVI